MQTDESQKEEGEEEDEREGGEGGGRGRGGGRLEVNGVRASVAGQAGNE